MTFFRRNITIGRAIIDKCDREACLESENCHDHHHKNKRWFKKWASHFRQAVLIGRSRPMAQCVSVPKVLLIFGVASVCIVIGIKAFTSITVASFRFFTSTQSDLTSDQPTMRSSKSLNPYWTEAEIFTGFFCSRMSNYIEDTRIANKQILLDLQNETVEISMNYYFGSAKDIVSQHIHDGGSWDLDKVHQIFLALETYRQSFGLERSNVTFVDIGAHIGWFSTVMAYAGYNVISFEAMPQNELILRKNQCAFNLNAKNNKWMIFNKALGEDKQLCRIVSHNINVGDGLTVCDENATLPPDYGVRASVQVERLDDIVDSDMIALLHIGVVKIDVENYEKFILLGGQNFFNSTTINLLLIEFLRGISEDTMSRNRFVYEFLNSSGFTVSRQVGGPLIMFDEIESSIMNGPLDAIAWRKDLPYQSY
jgi:FkbM family methyltransferase